MKTDNELIAEFMGCVPAGSGYKYPDCRANEIVDGSGYYDSTDIWYKDDFRYHESYDWLLPVLNQCIKVGRENKYPPVANALKITDSVERIYATVISFIKFYNSQPKTETKDQ